MPRPARASIPVLPLISLLIAGCGGHHGGFTTPDASQTDDIATPTDDTATGDVPASPADVSPRDVVRPDVQEPPDNTIVYAHSPTTLYAIDPSTLDIRVVGDFDWPAGAIGIDDGMADLAVDATGALVGVSFYALWTVDPATAHVQHISDLGGGELFNALTFVPAGVIDANTEVLMGGTHDGAYYRIDPTTGRATQLGTLVGGWGFAGDIVSVEGAGTYITVHSTSDTADTDISRLATLDIPSGRITPVGSTGVARVYGLAYWRSTLYAFSDYGDFITMDAHTGQSVHSSRPVPEFWGAGSTTIAPIVPP